MQQQYERKNLYLFSLIWMERGRYQENVFQDHHHELLTEELSILMVPLEK